MLTFTETLELWYKRFENMKPGDFINIQEIGKRDIELFTQICKCFIDEHEDFELSNDFKFLKRINNF